MISLNVFKRKFLLLVGKRRWTWCFGELIVFKSNVPNHFLLTFPSVLCYLLMVEKLKFGDLFAPSRQLVKNRTFAFCWESEMTMCGCLVDLTLDFVFAVVCFLLWQWRHENFCKSWTMSAKLSLIKLHYRNRSMFNFQVQRPSSFLDSIQVFSQNCVLSFVTASQTAVFVPLRQPYHNSSF